MKATRASGNHMSHLHFFPLSLGLFTHKWYVIVIPRRSVQATQAQKINYKFRQFIFPNEIFGRKQRICSSKCLVIEKWKENVRSFYTSEQIISFSIEFPQFSCSIFLIGNYVSFRKLRSCYVLTENLFHSHVAAFVFSFQTLLNV